ncbi:MAG TPA: hypothetical protein VG347_18145 [Verrucomicrobiae bacterium]|nr:hypothetical protein [Verrucomicrobiae bacterium]
MGKRQLPLGEVIPLSGPQRAKDFLPARSTMIETALNIRNMRPRRERASSKRKRTRHRFSPHHPSLVILHVKEQTGKLSHIIPCLPQIGLCPHFKFLQKVIGNGLKSLETIGIHWKSPRLVTPLCLPLPLCEIQKSPFVSFFGFFLVQQSPTRPNGPSSDTRKERSAAARPAPGGISHRTWRAIAISIFTKRAILHSQFFLRNIFGLIKANNG